MFSKWYLKESKCGFTFAYSNSKANTCMIAKTCASSHCYLFIVRFSVLFVSQGIPLGSYLGLIIYIPKSLFNSFNPRQLVFQRVGKGGSKLICGNTNRLVDVA